MLKQYQHWKEAPVDSIVLGLYYLQVFYYNEIERGLSGLGTYSLRPEFSSLLRPADEAITLKAYSPEEIVQRIKNQTFNEEDESPTGCGEDEVPNTDCDAELECADITHGTTKIARAK